ncbi:MAG: formylglycine-generating enzyme family protein [Puniceicoccales bacterium]|jgi:formylglycine-generating enzyme required for sulfatase activity|nr:formylglycine-generating enzyme family protein [Puniceicoccales bacterium]
MNTIQNKLSKTLLAGASIALLGAATPAYAQSVSLLDIESVHVPNDGYANVGYAYYVSKYEVTNAQYAVFLNAVASDKALPVNFLWDSSQDITQNDQGTTWSYVATPGKENFPVRYVSLLDAKRFCNWLTSFKNNGPLLTETGTYALIPYQASYTGYNDDKTTPVARAPRLDSAWQTGGVALLTVTEWEKAAYFDPNKGGGPGFWNYATTAALKVGNPTALDLPSTDLANYDNFYGSTTAVDLFEQFASAYGVVDMNGNVFEWTDIFRSDGTDNHFVYGGNFSSVASILGKGKQQYTKFYERSISNGIRVASRDALPTVFPVPEPSTYALIGGVGAVALAVLRRRRRD